MLESVCTVVSFFKGCYNTMLQPERVGVHSGIQGYMCLQDKEMCFSAATQETIVTG